jgi:hypothetical protein
MHANVCYLLVSFRPDILLHIVMDWNGLVENLELIDTQNILCIVMVI